MSIEQRIEQASSKISDLSQSFYGIYEILPEQFIHLDNHNVIFNKGEFKIVSNAIEPEIITYDVDNFKLRTHKSNLLPSIRVKLLSVNKYNVPPNDTVTELLENVLYMKTPTTIYITYHKSYDLYSVKNLNMATLFLMRKISNP